MSIYVPGFGTFDPEIPTWLELRSDGKLYNRNASDPNRVWVPPTDWRGYPGMTFTPEGSATPVPPPVEPPPPPPPPPPNPPTEADPMPAMLTELYAALDAEAQAEIEFREESSRQQALLLAKEAHVISLHKEVVIAYQAVLARLTVLASK